MRRLIAHVLRNVVQMIDLHSHVLPGIDDGPATVEESIALVRAAEAAGIQTIVATPHVSWRYPNDATSIDAAFQLLSDRLDADETSVSVLRGAEIAATSVAELKAGELRRLTLGGSRSLLLEPPFTPVITGFDDIARSLMSDGYEIVIAHPERCPAFHHDIEMLKRLVGAGARTSITAGSLSGRFGATVRRLSLRLLDEQLVHNVASDAHDLRGRPPGIASDIERAGYGGLRAWLTEDVPAAILSGAPIPSRPARALAETSAHGVFSRLRRR